MREYLFRGKHPDTGMWIYGGIAQSPDTAAIYIIEASQGRVGKAVAVDPNTVGQFTGEYDKHKQKIFEGDIVNKRGRNGSIVPMKVMFRHGRFCADYIHSNIRDWNDYSLWDSMIEVIGNEWDTPDIQIYDEAKRRRPSLAASAPKRKEVLI